MAAILVISALALPKNLVLPILLVVVSVLLVLGILFTGGKKWDTGDNQKMGYKNYYQRKAEEEKKKTKRTNKSHCPTVVGQFFVCIFGVRSPIFRVKPLHL